MAVPLLVAFDSGTLDPERQGSQKQKLTMDEFVKITTMDNGSTEGEGPTNPNTTPRTVARSDVPETPETDLAAVSATLEPLIEGLNAISEEGAAPSPPLNTPAFSAAPSVVGRFLAQAGRTRSLSIVAERLAALQIARGSGTTPGDKESVASADDVGETQSIQIALGSPNQNPRIDEYMTFPATGYASPGRKQNRDGDMEGSDRQGVVEKSIWAEEVMSDLERALKRLEQVAADEAAGNGMSAEDCYLARLESLLGSDRVWPVAVKKLE